MTKLKEKFHYRYLCAQADTPTKMLQEVLVISNPLRGVRKYWAVRKGCPSSCQLLPASFLVPGWSWRISQPSIPCLQVSFPTSIPERFPYVSLPTIWFYLVLPSILDLLWVFSSSFPSPMPSYLSPWQTNNRLGRNSDWILGVSMSDNDALIIYWSLQFHLREWLMFFCLWFLPPLLSKKFKVKDNLIHLCTLSF